MHCFHALPLPEQILIAVWVNTKDADIAVKASGYSSKLDADTFIKSKMYRRDFSAAYRAVSAQPALIHEPEALDIQAVKKMAVRAFEAEIGNVDQGRVEVVRLLWQILEAQKPNEN